MRLVTHSLTFSTIFILTLACSQRGQDSSQIKAVEDTASIQANVDGTFNVICKNGDFEEAVTAEQIRNDQVCEPLPTAQLTCEDNTFQTYFDGTNLAFQAGGDQFFNANTGEIGEGRYYFSVTINYSTPLHQNYFDSRMAADEIKSVCGKLAYSYMSDDFSLVTAEVSADILGNPDLWRARTQNEPLDCLSHGLTGIYFGEGSLNAGDRAVGVGELQTIYRSDLASGRRLIYSANKFENAAWRDEVFQHAEAGNLKAMCSGRRGSYLAITDEGFVAGYVTEEALTSNRRNFQFRSEGAR